MFNNPFGSFHDTVAEAKEDREGLGRLLTISTPRERLLVAAIAVMLLVLAAWLLLGSVARSVGMAGVLVEPGVAAFEGSRSIEALAWVDREMAPHLAPGMRAVIELAGAEGEAATALGGEVTTVAAVPLVGPLAGFEHTAPISIRRVRITLDEALDFAPQADSKCRIVIEIGRESPVMLFGVRRP